MLGTDAAYYGTPQFVTGWDTTLPARRPARASGKATLTVADLLRKYGPAYLACCGNQLDAYGRYVLQRLMDCRTEALGGHGWECEVCGHRQYAFNSCNNRHCPTCCTAPQLRWLEKVRGWQLPVRYYHVVFTVPHELCDLILANRGRLFSLLLRCSGETLLSLGREQLGAELGVINTPHGWGQLMLPHPHSHNIVTPGGLSLDGERWIDASETFLSRDDLAERFRKLYLRGIERLYRRGELILPNSMLAITSRAKLHAWLRPLRMKRWMVDCQPPPVQCADSDAVLKYLAKYVAGSVIHDWRIVSDDGEWVTFIAKNYRTGTRELIRIRGVEFVGRFCLHMLPRGFHRSRHFGLFSSLKRKEALELCRSLLGAAEPDAGETLEDNEKQEDDDDEPQSETRKRCPVCLLWAMVWIGRFTAAELYAHQASEKRLGELLLGVMTTWDVDHAESLSRWQQDINELRYWPLPFW